MIRNNANLIKWTSYALAFLLVFFFECCVLNRFPLHGAIPNLSILVVVAVALFEGSSTAPSSVWSSASSAPLSTTAPV